MNVVIARRLLPILALATLVPIAAGCGDDGGAASPATDAATTEAAASVVSTASTTESASSEPAATAPAATDAAVTAPEATELVTGRPTTTLAAGTATTVTLPPTTVPAPTVAPPATDAPPTTAAPTTAPPAPATTAAPIVIGGLTLATCIASEYFGFDAVEPRAEVALYQYTLRNLGYDPGDIDGYFGPLTLEAGANEIIDHTTDNAGLFIDEGVIHEEAFIRLGIAC